MELWVIVSLIIFALFSFILLWNEGVLRHRGLFIVSVLIILTAFAVRLSFMAHVTLDYTNFLSKWIEYFRENGGFAALSEPVGNYNVPYLYFLATFSYAGVFDLYLIKLLSVFFDIVLAFAAMRIVGIYTKSQKEEYLPIWLSCFCQRSF